MNARENLLHVIRFQQPERIGFDFNPPHESDLLIVRAARYIQNGSLSDWNQDPELLAKVPGFRGEVRLDDFGNIIGRLQQKTKGEIIRGALEADWALLDQYQLPEPDPAWSEELSQLRAEHPERLMLAALPISPFSTARNLRLLEQFLADVLLEPERVTELLAHINASAIAIIDAAAAAGADGICIYDDWGTQQALLISPATWRQLFRPAYQQLFDRTHQHGMAFFMHSCGYIREIMDDLAEMKLDVIQLDQPELMGLDELTKAFAGKLTFWCPVDIQKTMPTGDRALIEEQARRLIRLCGSADGGFIAKDYPSWEDINIEPEWADWAREIFLKEGWY